MFFEDSLYLLVQSGWTNLLSHDNLIPCADLHGHHYTHAHTNAHIQITLIKSTFINSLITYNVLSIWGIKVQVKLIILLTAYEIF